MNILIFGLGSIGQRHLRNIKILNSKANIYAIRKSFHTPSLNNKNIPIKVDLKKKFDLNYFKSREEALKSRVKFNAAIICTPTSLHIDNLIWCIKNGINVFLEKPLSNNLKKIKLLENLLERKNVIHMMGFQMKFDPLVLYLKKFLNKPIKKLGKLNFVNIHNGENIKNFHKYEDYKISYAAKKSLGGGILLSQIHEIEYFLDIFKDYKIIKYQTVQKKISSLQIDVPDTFNGNFILKKKKDYVLCNIHLNHYQDPKQKNIELIFDNGILNIDFVKKNISLNLKSKKYSKKIKYQRNDIFLKEIKFFLSHIKNNKKISKNFNLYNGIKTLKFVMKLMK